ncbi:hypothetical protein JHR70_000712 [Salmonella enterica]|nr:hypothetical protein [Salmonella enterica]
MINKPVINPRRTPAQQAQRDVFLKVAYRAREWLNEIIFNAEKDNWSDVEDSLPVMDAYYRKLKDTLSTDRAKPRGE